jgi:hypothetical protein
MRSLATPEGSTVGHDIQLSDDAVDSAREQRHRFGNHNHANRPVAVDRNEAEQEVR